MPIWIEIILAIFASVMSSSGVWLIIQKKMDKKDSRTKMLVGLGHMEIIRLCNYYIDRGYISAEEYDDLYTYLYKPYEELGGNGSAERAIQKVKNLEFRG